MGAPDNRDARANPRPYLCNNKRIFCNTDSRAIIAIDMANKYDPALLGKNVEQYEKDKATGFDAYCDQLWNQMWGSSMRGIRTTTKQLREGNNDALYAHVCAAFPGEKYAVSRKFAHAFQCDCDKEEGCCEWVTVTFK